MSEAEKAICSSCGHELDPNARTCPYCAADPKTGERDPSLPEVGEILPRKPKTTPTEKIATTIRSRSGLVFTISLAVGIALLIGVSSWVDKRQRQAAADVHPVPLTEVSDLASNPQDAEAEIELPELDFELDGNPDAMETFILEEGEVKPKPDPEEMSTEGDASPARVPGRDEPTPTE